MSEIHSTSGTLPAIPDDLTIPQFQLDYIDPNRPTRHANIPCLIDDASGKKVYLEEVCIFNRTCRVIIHEYLEAPRAHPRTCKRLLVALFYWYLSPQSRSVRNADISFSEGENDVGGLSLLVFYIYTTSSLGISIVIQQKPHWYVLGIFFLVWP